MILWSLASLVSCNTTPPITDPGAPWKGKTFAEAGGANLVQLDRTVGEYTLPEHNLPPGLEVGETFVFTGSDIVSTRRKGNRFSYDVVLPFYVRQERLRPTRPFGMEVEADGQRLRFSGRPPAQVTKRDGWTLHEGRLIVSFKSPPREIKVLFPQVQRDLQRLGFATAGLPAEAFVRHEMTIGDTTRAGLLLPAPGKAEWQIDVPSNGKFSAWFAMAPAPVRPPSRDGAELRLVVVADGKEAVLDTQPVPADAEQFERWDVNLSAYSGQNVVVRLETLPRTNPTMDLVFIGSPDISGRPEGDVRRVVFIGLDTTRPDHFGYNGYPKPTTPNLDKFGRSSVTFDRSWATAPRTRPSFRSSTTGRWPLDAVGATNIGEVFARNNWATAGIVANMHLARRFDFHRGYDRWTLDPRAKADRQVDRGLAWLRDHQDRDAFLFLHIMDPHIFYVAPEKWRNKFASSTNPMLPSSGFNRWQVYTWDRQGKLTDEIKRDITSLYDAELAYTDHELGRLLRTVEAMPGQTLVVLHTDHGEEFWEHDGFEHNHTLYDEVVRSILWVHPPGGHKGGYRVDTPVTNVDIAPTLFDFAGIDDVPPLDGRSLVPLMRGETGPEWQERALPIAYIQYEQERWAIVQNGHKYILWTGSGREELYDLHADPMEQTDLHVNADLGAYREALGKAHQLPVGPGWRLKLSLAGTEPITVSLPARARMADVLDPEVLKKARANLEWGERPKKTVDDVGRVALSEDGRTLTFTPAPKARGVLYVMFDAPVDPAGARVERNGAPLTLFPTGSGQHLWSEGKQSLSIRAGTVVVPPDGEYARMKKLAGEQGGGSADEMEALKQLGYVGGH